MGIVFKAPYPVFGRGKPLPLGHQQRSPYYWWWAYLRRNEDYLACCAAGGTGPLAGLYADFGDVQNDNFKAWWAEHGYRLFAEQRKPVRLMELHKPSEWDAAWQPESVMVVAVPLDLPKRYLQGFFAKLLKERHKGERGRKALSDSDASTARYPLHRNCTVHTLRIQLAVYDAVTAKNKGEDGRTLAEIGADMRLVPTALPNSKDSPMEATAKRNVMTATVSRYYREARKIVANTAKGQFPNSK